MDHYIEQFQLAVDCEDNGIQFDKDNIFSVLFVPEELLLEDEEEDVVVVECGDINTELGHRDSLSDILEIVEE